MRRPSAPSIVQMAVGAAITPFREPLAPLLAAAGAGDVMVGLPESSASNRTSDARALPVAALPGSCQRFGRAIARKLATRVLAGVRNSAPPSKPAPSLLAGRPASSQAVPTTANSDRPAARAVMVCRGQPGGTR